MRANARRRVWLAAAGLLAACGGSGAGSGPARPDQSTVVSSSSATSVSSSSSAPTVSGGSSSGGSSTSGGSSGSGSSGTNPSGTVAFARHTLTVRVLGCGDIGAGCGARVQIIPPNPWTGDPSKPDSWAACGDDKPLIAGQQGSTGGPCIIPYAVGSNLYPNGPPTVLITTVEGCRMFARSHVVDGAGTTVNGPDCHEAANFLGWGGDCAGSSASTAAGGICEVVMDRDRTVEIGYSFFVCPVSPPLPGESQNIDGMQVAGRFLEGRTVDPAQCGNAGATPVVWGPEQRPKPDGSAQWAAAPDALKCPPRGTNGPSGGSATSIPLLFAGLPGFISIVTGLPADQQNELGQLANDLVDRGCP